MLGEEGDVTGERRRVTGDVGDGARASLGNPRHDGTAGPLARRVEHHNVGGSRGRRRTPGRRRRGRPPGGGPRSPSRPPRPAVGLDRETRPGRRRRRGTAANRPTPAYRSSTRSSRCGSDLRAPLDQGSARRGAPARTRPPPPRIRECRPPRRQSPRRWWRRPGSAIRQSSTGPGHASGACAWRVDRRAGGRTACGSAIEPVDVAGDALDHHRTSRPASRELLRTTCLQPRCLSSERAGSRSHRRPRPGAPGTVPRPGRATRCAPDRVARRNRRRRSLGHLDLDPLPRDRVPDEDHPALGEPGHEVTSVRHRPDIDREPLPYPRPTACLTGARSSGHDT